MRSPSSCAALAALRIAALRAARVLAAGAALLLLNAGLTFYNVWPTLAITWEPRNVSGEVAVLVLVLALWTARSGAISSRALACLAAAFVLLVVARYGEVTAPALFGRAVNLYWDAPHVANVVAMLAGAAPAWITAGAVLTVAAALAALYAASRWALGTLATAATHPAPRRALLAVGAAGTVLFALAEAGMAMPEPLRFSIPVTRTYADQIRLIARAAAGPRDDVHGAERALAAATFANLRGGDAYVVFLESYGAVAFERPAIARRLAPERAALAAAAVRSGRRVLSAYVEAPTFGGGSWLSHLTLLTGIEARDPDRYAQVMRQPRDSLVQAFTRAGYRSIAVMPGLRQSWPEGEFYRFARIYGADALDWRGPGFGWWRIPDQFALARLEQLEVRRTARAPLFAFFTTISSHMPFRPTPPYQPDWTRLAGTAPYDDGAHAALAETPAWLDLAPSYAESMAYAYRSLAGFVARRAGENATFVVLGDHQPAAAVTGPGATWNVPVHVITSSEAVAEALAASGFVEGIEPATRAIGRMHELLPVLLRAFGERGTLEQSAGEPRRERLPELPHAG